MTCACQRFTKMGASTSACQQDTIEKKGENKHGMNKGVTVCLFEIKSGQLRYDILMQCACFEEIRKLFVKSGFWGIGSIVSGLFG